MSLRTLYFIGHCLSLDEHPSFRETIITQFSAPDYDWQSFIWICSNHLILPVIYLKFRKHDLLDYLPEVLSQHLEEIYTLNCKRNELILQQMKEINATLNQVGISPIYLKGTGNLIDGVYSDIGERIIGDIDFLVAEKDFLTAIELFKKEGYAICRPNNEPLDQIKHYPRLWKEDVVADIEIHRLPVTIKYSIQFSTDLVQQAKKAVSGHPGCYVLSDNHKIILNFIHSQLTNAGHALGIVALRDINDIYCFSKRIDLQTIPQIAPFRQKCIAYLKISEKLLNLTDSFYPYETIRSKSFRFKHDLNINSRFIYKINRFNWVISEAVNYAIQRTHESFTDSQLRLKIINRLFTPSWYRHNLKSYLQMYNGNK